MTRVKARQPGRVSHAVLAERLAEAERLFQDFKDLTPYRFTRFVRAFDSFAAYERWKRAQDDLCTDNRETRTILGVRVPYLDRTDLIRSKQTGQASDLADIEALSPDPDEGNEP